jgi:GNAT superfamily N-acetyltransferase
MSQRPRLADLLRRARTVPCDNHPVDGLALIRDARDEDGELLDGLHRRSSLVSEDYRAALAVHPDALGVPREAISEGRVRVAVSERDGLLAFASVRYPGFDVCELDDLFVEPGMWRRGVGSALVQDAARRANDAGCTTMTVVSAESNFSFYESVGFVPGEPAATRFGPATRMSRTI